MLRNVILFIVGSSLLSACSTADRGKRIQLRKKISAELSHSLKTELLDIWYPTCQDTVYGGFLSTFSAQFKPTGDQNKFIVTQARHVWTTAKAAELYPDTPIYPKLARHGFQFLKNVMWDNQYGGFYSLVDRSGKVLDNDSGKTAYGNSFGIYALAAYYHQSHDDSVLDLAKKAFHWMEDHSHDSVFKGYFQHLKRDGTPIKRSKETPPGSDLGYKDQNSSIHLLEAFTELYTVWKDSLLGERLREMFFLVRDKITDDKGNLILFFQPDWTPVSFRDSSREFILANKNLDHTSFGHDIETAYLLLEASHALGNLEHEKTLMAGKKMVDHALNNGWDSERGGFYDEGYYFKGSDSITIILNSKNWWAQAEGLNTLLLMSDYFPDDPMNYFEKFQKQWNYIDTYLIDHEHGDWYQAGLDETPDSKSKLKGHIWKGAYHNFRSLANCVAELNSKSGSHD